MVIPHLAESDYREPLLTFALPEVLATHLGANPTTVYGFFVPSDIFWIEVLSFVCLTTVAAAFTASIVYHFIVDPKKSDTSTAFVLGYGVLLPFWLGWPFLIYPLLDVRNLLLKFIVGGVIPTLVEFRLSEAIHGCYPDHATTSLQDFVIYFASALVFERDSKTNSLMPATTRMKLKCLLSFVGLLFTMGAFQSILSLHQDFNVFGNTIARDGWHSMDRFMTWELYANSLLQAMMFQIYLTTYSEGLRFLWIVVTGYQTKKVMNNPLGGATSPSDFWGRRWNMLVQSVLKGGVYKPMRKYQYSPTVAAISTFLMSGLFHEWLVFGMFATACAADPSGPTCYRPLYGGAMVFFGWQALLIAFEYLWGRTPVLQRMTRQLPTPARTIIIIGLGLPLAHFFCEPYVRTGFFRHGQMALPMILSLQQGINE